MMRLARVMGTVTMTKKLSDLQPGRYLICEAFDGQALRGMQDRAPREKSMPESLVVFDDLGAGEGQIIAVSEGREATMPWYPQNVP
ncbi:MAG: EutN/CcmL family microcompartment protein, partial [Phycisphaeraceae bacterium]|nr:EutN/CcmL family microcompartment protein [Phycisphaeraceae bacterium]